MKKVYALLLAAAAMVALNACGHKEENELAHHHHHDHAGHDHAAHDHESEEAGAIVLEPAVAKKFGLSTFTISEEPVSQTIKVSATVATSSDGYAVVSAPSAGIITLASNINVGAEVRRGSLVASIKADAVSGGDQGRIAKVELDAARTEFERVEALWADRLVTRAQYDAARAAYERARAAYSAPAASNRAAAPIAGVITSIEAPTGSFVEVGTPIATISASNRLTIRADVPSRYASMLPSVSDARVVLPYSGESILVSALDGKRIGSGSAAAGRAGYVPLTFSVANTGVITPGQAVELYLLAPSDRRAISVPRSALVEQQGTFFVFVQLDEDCYRKQPVAIGASDGASVEITSGLKIGEKVVDKGAVAVRLAESSGNVPEGHSHSH